MKSKTLAECLCYSALAIGMALAMGFWVRKRDLSPSAGPQHRAPAEAAELRSALGISKNVSTVIEFFDFQCPPCRMAYPTIKAVLRRHPDVRYRPVNFPLSMHPFAFGAAVASEMSGGDLRTIDDLMTGKAELDPASLNAYLKRKGLQGIVGTKAAKPYEDRVKADVALGDKMRVQGTPTILVLSAKGELVQVHSANQIESAL